jgi:uncharacterized protein YkwD
MVRQHPDGWSAARQVLFTLVPLVIGAGVLIAGGDGPAPGMSRLEATQSSVVPTTSAADAPVVKQALEAPVEAGVEAGGGSPAPAAPGTTEMAAPATAGAAPAPAAAVNGDAGASAEVSSPVTAGSPATSAPAPATTAPSTTSSTTTSTTTTTTTPPARSRNAGAEAEVVPLTNADRTANGLGALSRDSCLDSVASGFAEQMARTGVLAHNPGGGAGVTGCRAGATWGDNVGMSSECDTALLEREWMASPGHRRNILTGAFTLIGVGAWTDEKGACWVQVLFSS